MQPLFSLIIPTYNRSLLLPRAIESVLEQSFQDWELIIVDDGSTDETRQVAGQYDDHRIRYEHQEHGERSRARNRGIALARGRYICFLDDDDYFLSHHLSVLEQSIREAGYPEAVFRTGMLIESREERRPSPNYPVDGQQHPALFFLKHMAGTHTLCYHRVVFEQHQFDPRWYHFQDTHLLVRILLDFPFHQLDAYTAVYCIHDQMGSRGVFQRADAIQRTENNIAAIKDLFLRGGSRLRAITGADLERKLVAGKYLDHANGALLAGRRRLALELFVKAEKDWSLWKQYGKFLIKWCLSRETSS